MATSEGPITRADIEAKLRQIKGQVDETATATRPYLGAVAGVAAVAGLTLAYALGRRKGRRQTTVVEVRRV